ncbi:MAG: hypothetical protein ACREEZ_09710, partial [Stellaceae bacterium]
MQTLCTAIGCCFRIEHVAVCGDRHHSFERPKYAVGQDALTKQYQPQKLDLNAILDAGQRFPRTFFLAAAAAYHQRRGRVSAQSAYTYAIDENQQAR